MKDWLDSDECSKLFDDLLHSAVNYEDSRDYYLKLIEKIREHFLPKNEETYKAICKCVAYGLYIDEDELRKLVLGEE